MPADFDREQKQFIGKWPAPSTDNMRAAEHQQMKIKRIFTKVSYFIQKLTPNGSELKCKT